MTRLSEYETLLLIDKPTGAIFPFSSHGFGVATGGVAQVVKRAGQAVFFDSSGTTFRIELKLKKIGVLASLCRLLGGPYEIEVVRKPVEIPLDRLKEFVRCGVGYNRAHYLDVDDDWSFMKRTDIDIESLLSRCQSKTDLYTMLELPNAVNCLDLL